MVTREPSLLALIAEHAESPRHELKIKKVWTRTRTRTREHTHPHAYTHMHARARERTRERARAHRASQTS
eukprot:6184945-Pleurochrysis_carterae.AAC.1